MLEVFVEVNDLYIHVLITCTSLYMHFHCCCSISSPSGDVNYREEHHPHYKGWVSAQTVHTYIYIYIYMMHPVGCIEAWSFPSLASGASVNVVVMYMYNVYIYIYIYIYVYQYY